MNTITESFLASLVKQMREAQVNYFEAISTAKRTRLPDDFASAKKFLDESKALEKLVDASVDHTIRQVDETDRLRGICHDVKVALLDKFGLFGGGEAVNKIFDILNKALPAEV